MSAPSDDPTRPDLPPPPAPRTPRPYDKDPDLWYLVAEAIAAYLASPSAAGAAELGRLAARRLATIPRPTLEAPPIRPDHERAYYAAFALESLNIARVRANGEPPC